MILATESCIYPMLSHYKRRLLAFLLLVGISTTTLSVVTLSAAEETDRDSKWLNHTYTVLLTLTRPRSLIKDNVLLCGRYLATRDDKLLPVLASHKDSLSNRLEQLLLLTDDNLAQQQQVLKLRALILGQLRQTDSILEIVKSLNDEAAAVLYEKYTVYNLIPQISQLVRTIEDNETKLLNKRSVESEHHRKFSWTLIWVIISGTFAIAVFSFIILSRQSKRLSDAQEETRKLNETLEDRVTRKIKLLQEQEDTYGKTLDNLMEGVQVIGYDWTYLYLNDIAVAQSKKTREELIGYNIFEIFPEIKTTKLYDILRDCMEQRKQGVFENKFRYADGSASYFELHIEPTKEGLFILSMDISDRKTREKERLRRAEDVRGIVNKISHEIRQPITSLMGISQLTATGNSISEGELKMILHEMKASLTQLDERTHHLSTYVNSLQLNEYTNDTYK